MKGGGINVDHPVITQIEKYGYPLHYLNDDTETYFCDGCGDIVNDEEVFELDGDVYCSIRCLTRNTDVRYGYPDEFK